MKKNYLIIILSIAVMFTMMMSCHKNNENEVVMNDVQQFEAVWNELNDTYVLWSIDTTDWDEVYSKYHPLFEEMDDKPDYEWSNTWKELTSTLLDHHLTIKLTRSPMYSTVLRPGQDEVEKRDYYHGYKLYHDILLNKMTECGRLVDTVSSGIPAQGPEGSTITRLVYSGVMDQEIVYIHIPEFNSLLDTIDAFVHFKHLVSNEEIKAAIIDVRDNPGGISTNLEPLLSCFTTESVLFGYSQTKLGLCKYDLSVKTPSIVHPSCGQMREIPIIVLTDVNSASMAEISAIALKHLSQCYVVGERTWGATCAASDYRVKKEGSSYAITTAQILFEDVDGTVYEGHGVEPDIECLFNQSLWNSGVDNQLEMAISVAKDKILENGN